MLQVMNLLKYVLVGIMFAPVSKADEECTVASLTGNYELNGDFNSFKIWRLGFDQGKLISSSNEDLSTSEWPVSFLPDEWDNTRFRVVQSSYGSEAIVETTAHLRVSGCIGGRAIIKAVAAWSVFFDETGEGAHALTPHVFQVKAEEIK